jgi:hypothetical protein
MVVVGLECGGGSEPLTRGQGQAWPPQSWPVELYDVETRHVLDSCDK